MKLVHMIYHHTNSGFCRVHYKIKNPQNQWVYYCLMEDSTKEIKLYRCGVAPYYEPDYPIAFDFNVFFDLPKENDVTSLKIKKYLLENKLNWEDEPMKELLKKVLAKLNELDLTIDWDSAEMSGKINMVTFTQIIGDFETELKEKLNEVD